jgi:hypothetical protein
MKPTFFKGALVGGIAGAVMAAGTAALAGTGVGGVFNLGQPNTVNGTSSLAGATAGPQLKVQNTNVSNQAVSALAGGGSGIALFGTHTTAAGAGPAVEGSSASTADNAYSVLGLLSSSAPGANSAAVRGQNNGTGTAGFGVYGSQAGQGVGIYGTAATGTGIGVSGRHLGSTGTGAGVRGQTASSAGAGVLGVNTAGGPGLSAIVNSGVAPLQVNSSTKVTNLNADKLDNFDSTALWKLGGNAGTTPGTDFLGTTDDKALVLKTNNAEAVRVDTAGKVGIGTATPSEKLEVNGNIRAHSVLYSQGFEGATFPPSGWTNDGWKRDTLDPYEGTAYARDVPTGPSRHTLQTTFTFPTRGVVRFVWSLNAGAQLAGLVFCVDSCGPGSRSADTTDWTTVAVPVAAGTHTLTWVHDTNGSGSIASLDAVQFEALRDIHATGAVTGTGTARALVHYNGTLQRCYRGDVDATSANRDSCGSPWAVTGSGGDTTITFPFDVNDGFVSITAEYTGAQPVFATYDFPASNQIRVRTFNCSSTCAQLSANYSLAVF